MPIDNYPREDIDDIIKEKDFNNMRTKSIYNDMFDERVLVEAYRGSISHGLEVKKDGEKFVTDDIDTISIYRYPEQYYLTLEGFNRVKNVYEKKEDDFDLVAYEVMKAFHLLFQLNPNVTPILFVKREHYLTISDEFQHVLNNKEVFYSKNRLRDVYLGYAQSQYKKMLQKGQYFGYMGSTRKEQYEHLGYDAKHAQHAIRLLRCGQEWLVDGQPQIFRENDRDQLLSIKMGEWKLEQIKQLYNKEMDLLDQAFLKSKLPEKNNSHEVNKLLFEVMTF